MESGEPVVVRDIVVDVVPAQTETGVPGTIDGPPAVVKVSEFPVTVHPEPLSKVYCNV